MVSGAVILFPAGTDVKIDGIVTMLEVAARPRAA